MLTGDGLDVGWLIPAAIAFALFLLILRVVLRGRRSEAAAEPESHPLPALPPLARAEAAPPSPVHEQPATWASAPAPGAPLVAVSGASSVEDVAPVGSLLAALGLPESVDEPGLPSQSQLPMLDATRHSPFEPSLAGVAAVPRVPEPPPPAAPESLDLDDWNEQASPSAATWEPLLPPLRGALVGTSRLDRRLARAGFQRSTTRFAYLLLLLGFGLAGAAGWRLLALGFPPPLDLGLTAACFGLAMLGPSLWLDLRGLRGSRRLRDDLADRLDLAALLYEGGEDGRTCLMRMQQLGGPTGRALRLALPRLTTAETREREAGDAAARTGVEATSDLLRSAWSPEPAEFCRTAAARSRAAADRDVDAWARRTPFAAAGTILGFVLPAIAVLLLGPAILDLAHRLLPALGL